MAAQRHERMGVALQNRGREDGHHAPPCVQESVEGAAADYDFRVKRTMSYHPFAIACACGCHDQKSRPDREDDDDKPSGSRHWRVLNDCVLGEVGILADWRCGCYFDLLDGSSRP